MSNKFAILGIITDQADTLVDAHSHRPKKSDYAVLYGLPLAVGGVSLSLRWTIGGISELLSGMAIFTGLLFGLVVWVFQLRIQAANDPRVPGTSSLAVLLDELFKNVLYAVLVGILTVAVIICETSLQPEPTLGSQNPAHANIWWSAGLLFIISHFLLAFAMCLKRVRSAYQQLTTE